MELEQVCKEKNTNLTSIEKGLTGSRVMMVQNQNKESRVKLIRKSTVIRRIIWSVGLELRTQ